MTAFNPSPALPPLQATPFGAPGAVPPVASIGAPGALPTPTAVPTGNATSAPNGGDLAREVKESTVIIGYIAPRKNTIKEVPLDTIAAKEAWDAAVKDGKIDTKTTQTKTVTDAKGNSKTVTLEAGKDKFTPSLFNAFYPDVDAAKYNEIKARQAFRVDTSEARVDRYILQVVGEVDKNLNGQVCTCLADAASEMGSASSYIDQQKVAVFTSKQLVSFMLKTQAKVIDIVAKNSKQTINGKAPKVATLCLDARERSYKKKVADKDTAGNKIGEHTVTVQYTEVYCLIVNTELKRKTIRDLYYGVNDTDNVEENKVAYAVLRDECDSSGVAVAVKDGNGNPTGQKEYRATIDVNQVLNKERYEKLFPEQSKSLASMKSRKAVSKKAIEESVAANNPGASPEEMDRLKKEAYAKAKSDLLISYENSNAQAFGITPQTWSTLSTQTSSGQSGKTISLAEQQNMSARVLNLFSNGVKDRLGDTFKIK